jgi:hypothetical protein
MVLAGQVLEHPMVTARFTFARQSNQSRYVCQIRLPIVDCHWKLEKKTTADERASGQEGAHRPSLPSVV